MRPSLTCHFGILKQGEKKIAIQSTLISFDMLKMIQGLKNLNLHAHFFKVPSEVAAHFLYGFVKRLIFESILTARQQ